MQTTRRQRFILALYRFEQRLGITSGEFKAIVILASLYATGAIAGEIRNSSVGQAIDYSADIEAITSLAKTMRPNMGETLLVGPIQPKWANADPSTVLSSYSETKPVEESAAQSERGPSGARSARKVNINEASLAELQALPRVGPKLAERIVTYRSQRGAFRSVDQLIRVSGIGEKTLAQLRSFATVEDPTVMPTLGSNAVAMTAN